MIVKAYYSGGRIDAFDTDRMTDGVPQPGNLLTNYTLDLADVNGESLWLCSYYYEAADAYKEEPGPKKLPVARRRDGWSFLIADADDLQKLNRVTLDGETVLVQIAGELVDATALSWASEVEAFSLRIAEFPRLLKATEVEGVEGLGIPPAVISELALTSDEGDGGMPRF